MQINLMVCEIIPLITSVTKTKIEIVELLRRMKSLSLSLHLGNKKYYV